MAPSSLPAKLLLRCELFWVENGSCCSEEAKGGLGNGKSISSSSAKVGLDGRRLERESAQ
jgi:hypothetical protein